MGISPFVRDFTPSESRILTQERENQEIQIGVNSPHLFANYKRTKEWILT